MELSVNGHKTYVSTGGVDWAPGKPLLCLMHGASMDHTVWTLYTRYFARTGYNVLAPDLSGHARSEGPLLTSIADMGTWLAALVDQAVTKVNTDSVILAGHSMGSLICLEAATKGDYHLSHLALLGTAVPMRVGDPLLDAAKANEPLSRDIVAIFGHAYASRLGGNPIAGVSVLNTALALMAQAGDDVMYHDMRACHEYETGFDTAGLVTAKTSLIVGMKDKMTSPKLAASLAEKFPDAVVTRLADSGHMMMAEQPEETLQAMKAAFAR